MALALPRAAKPLWLITLADLSLLLVGFFVFLQAASHKPQHQQAAIEASIRNAFGGDSQARLTLDANLITGFSPGSAELPAGAGPVIAWARDALADPRTRLMVTGYSDGSAADRRDGSALALAGLRADAAIAALDGVVAPDRLRPGAAIAPGPPRVTLAITYDP